MPETACITAFDRTNPRAVSYARQQSSALVTRVTNETRSAIRAVIGDALESGMAPRVSAKILRSIVGLTERDARAIAKMVREMKSAGATEKAILRRVESRTKQMIRRRSILIARTETLRSANAGQTELWKQARRARELPSTIKRVWIVTPDERLRKTHAEISGQVVSIDRPFKRMDGVDIEPGGEPNCRCTQAIASPEQIAASRQKFPFAPTALERFAIAPTTLELSDA